MDEITKQADFLSRNHIESSEDLEAYKTSISDRYNSLINERKALYGKIKRCRNESTKILLEEDIKAVTNELAELRKTIKLCDQVENRSQKMEENLNKVEQLENETKEAKKKKGR